MHSIISKSNFKLTLRAHFFFHSRLVDEKVEELVQKFKDLKEHYKKDLYFADIAVDSPVIEEMRNMPYEEKHGGAKYEEWILYLECKETGAFDDPEIVLAKIKEIFLYIHDLNFCDHFMVGYDIGDQRYVVLSKDNKFSAPLDGRAYALRNQREYI